MAQPLSRRESYIKLWMYWYLKIIAGRSMAHFAVANADQNDRDYEVMIQAVRDGRIEVQLEE